MNEIKFRAWDTTDNTMWEPWNPYITQFQAFEIADRLCSGRFLRKEEEHNYIFSQYTWLKDMNWKEIFEGDVVELHNWGIRSNEEIIWISEIYWDTEYNQWDFKMIDWEYIDDQYGRWRQSPKIIWNIYENPNLLTNE